MIQALSILAIVLAIGLPTLDYAILRPHRRDAAPAGGLERAVYILFIIALALMVVSGILPLAIRGHMHGWMLILHMSIAPLLCLCLAGLSLLWCKERSDPLTVLVMLAGLVTIVSALLGMMSWFGSDAQRTLLNLHRISSMILLIAVAVQASRLLGQPHAARTGD